MCFVFFCVCVVSFRYMSNVIEAPTGMNIIGITCSTCSHHCQVGNLPLCCCEGSVCAAALATVTRHISSKDVASIY